MSKKTKMQVKEKDWVKQKVAGGGEWYPRYSNKVQVKKTLCVCFGYIET